MQSDPKNSSLDQWWTNQSRQSKYIFLSLIQSATLRSPEFKLYGNNAGVIPPGFLLYHDQTLWRDTIKLCPCYSFSKIVGMGYTTSLGLKWRRFLEHSVYYKKRPPCRVYWKRNWYSSLAGNMPFPRKSHHEPTRKTYLSTLETHWMIGPQRTVSFQSGYWSLAQRLTVVFNIVTVPSLSDAINRPLSKVHVVATLMSNYVAGWEIWRV